MSEETKQDENPILAKIKGRVAGKDREEQLKKKGEVLEKLYSEEGESRAEERQKEEKKQNAEKTQYFPTSVRIKLAELKRFSDLAFKIKALRGRLTYESVFLMGLETLEGKNDDELEEYVKVRKKLDFA